MLFALYFTLDTTVTELLKLILKAVSLNESSVFHFFLTLRKTILFPFLLVYFNFYKALKKHKYKN